MINLTYIVIGMLVAEISMVFYIFRWAMKAIRRFRESVLSLLKGEDEDGQALLDSLGKSIYNRLYRTLNLKLSPKISLSPAIQQSSENPQEDAGESEEPLEGPQPGPQPGLADMLANMAQGNNAGSPLVQSLAASIASKYNVNPAIVSRILGEVLSKENGSTQSTSGQYW